MIEMGENKIKSKKKKKIENKQIFEHQQVSAIGITVFQTD